MRAAAVFGLGVTVTLAAAAIGAAAFIYSGAYDIGADAHHTQLLTAIIEVLRERSIGVRAASIAAPDLGDADEIAAGASRYSTLCVGCHLAPGVATSAVRAGLYPRAPNLMQTDLNADRSQRCAPGVLDGQARHQDERDARVGKDPGRRRHLADRGVCPAPAGHVPARLPAAREQPG